MARRCCSAVSGAAASSVPTRIWIRWGAPATRLQRDLGGQRCLRRSRSAVTRIRRATIRTTSVRQRPVPGPVGRRRAPCRSAQLVRAVDAVQRLGPLRAHGSAGEQRRALLPAHGRPGAAVAHRARRGSASVHGGGGLGRSRSRAWASPATTSRGRLSGLLPDQPGREPLQTLRRASATGVSATSGMARGINAAHPFVGDTTLPSTAWHAQFEDVNNDGLIDLFIAKGNVTDQPDYAAQDPSDLLLGQPDGTFREAADAAGIVELRPRTRRRDRRPQPRRAARHRRGELWSAGRVWRNVGTGIAARPAAMGNWLELRARARAAERRRDRRMGRGTHGRAEQRRELTIGGGHAGGQLGWIHFGLGAGRRGRGPRGVAWR